MTSRYKRFSKYEEAHALYSDIVSGRDSDRKNASIMWMPSDTTEGHFVVYWMSI